MSHWPFVLAAYGLTVIGTAGLSWWSFSAMRRAEAEADALRQRQ